MTPAGLPHRRERGAALLETALALPMVLLIAVGIFEFGRAYQTWQVVTNAAREGARMAVLPGTSQTMVTERVKAYLTSGQLKEAANATVQWTQVQINLGGSASAPASKVTVNYPFEFIVLQPVASLVVSGSKLGAPFTMSTSAVMRNE